MKLLYSMICKTILYYDCANILGVEAVSLEIDRPEAIVQTPCGHVFHRRCLGGWMQVARSCPLCRADVAV